MDDTVIRLRGLHGTIPLRLFVANDETLATCRLYDELARRKSATEISAAVAGLQAAALATTARKNDIERIALTSDGQRQGRMLFEVIALTDVDLARPATSAVQFLAFFEQPEGRRKKISRWQMAVLQWKWLFRRT